MEILNIRTQISIQAPKLVSKEQTLELEYNQLKVFPLKTITMNYHLCDISSYKEQSVSWFI